MSLLFLLQILLILLLDLSPDIFYASPRQVEDEQVNDELPHLESGSPVPALPEDPP